MRYYPVCLAVQDKKCLVVGGGSVGVRKVKTLVDCGAQVTVVTLELVDTLRALAESGQITTHIRGYRSSDLEQIFLVIGATSDRQLNEQISREADAKNILCNIADVPEACNFILPAVVQRGDLQLSISTSGQSPAFAKHLRQELEASFGEEYAVFLDLMGSIRRKLLAEEHQPEAHKNLFEQLISGGLLEMIKQQDKTRINVLLKETLGAGFELNQLGLDI